MLSKLQEPVESMERSNKWKAKALLTTAHIYTLLVRMRNLLEE